jgi:hypothetical protein
MESTSRTVLEKPEDVTPDWLTEVLRRKPDLAGTRVASVAITRSNPTIVSLIARLSVAYDGEPPAGAPTRLFLKMTNENWASKDGYFPGDKEVTFYRDVVPAMADPPVPICYDAAFDPSKKRFHLLLEDLSDSHREFSDPPVPPTVTECERLMETYARLHASMWGDSRLGSGIGKRPDFDRFGRDMAKWLAGFADLMGDRLSAERRARCERIVAAYPRLGSRFTSTKDLTLGQGDSHVWNLLYPREGGSGDVRLVDWESWEMRPGAWDLAYMMAVFWYPSRRHVLEDRLLQHYHHALIAQGVRGYDMDALRLDYRLGVIALLDVPLWQAQAPLPPGIWWQHFERIMLAFEDLGCEEVLEGLSHS